jgi:hypothetical protein
MLRKFKKPFVFDGKRNKAEHLQRNDIDGSDTPVQRSAFGEEDNQHARDQGQMIPLVVCNAIIERMPDTFVHRRSRPRAATGLLRRLRYITGGQIPKVRLNNGMYCRPNRMITAAK